MVLTSVHLLEFGPEKASDEDESSEEPCFLAHKRNPTSQIPVPTALNPPLSKTRNAKLVIKNDFHAFQPSSTSTMLSNTQYPILFFFSLFQSYECIIPSYSLTKHIIYYLHNPFDPMYIFNISTLHLFSPLKIASFQYFNAR